MWKNAGWNGILCKEKLYDKYYVHKFYAIFPFYLIFDKVLKVNSECLYLFY